MDTAPSLQDLPPELRKTIYALFLAEANPIGNSIWRPKVSGNKPEDLGIVRQGHNHLRRHLGHIFDHSSKTWVAAPAATTSSLRAGRQVYLDAIQVLYGANEFVFNKTNVLQAFLHSIGQNKAHSRYIKIQTGGWMVRQSRPAMTELVAAHNLRRLDISVVDLCQGSRTPKMVAESCKPLLMALATSYREQNLGLDVVEVLQVRAEVCRWRHHRRKPWFTLPDDESHSRHIFEYRLGREVKHCGCRCDKSERKHGKLRRELKAEVRALLAA